MNRRLSFGYFHEPGRIVYFELGRSDVSFGQLPVSLRHYVYNKNRIIKMLRYINSQYIYIYIYEQNPGINLHCPHVVFKIAHFSSTIIIKVFHATILCANSLSLFFPRLEHMLRRFLESDVNHDAWNIIRMLNSR